MSLKTNYWISPKNESWALKKEGTSRSTGIFQTQSAAVDYGRDLLKRGQGGELITKNKENVIRSKDTINRKDPMPPKDKEH